MLKIDERVRDQIVEFLRQYAMREVEGVVEVLRRLERIEEEVEVNEEVKG